MKLAAAALLLGVVVSAAGPGRTQAANATPDGYLSQDDIVRLAATVPVAPMPGTAEYVNDQRTSALLMALEDSDRWLLARRHAELRPVAALAHFDCALGFRIATTESPRLVAILTRVLHDANEAAELAKARAMRMRPVGDDPGRQACQTVTPAQRMTASHPSGSATVGTAYATVMATLVPDRAEAITEIGRQIGISRMVCAMHYPSDVTDGAALGETVGRAIIATPGFASDADIARDEIAAARAAARTSPACAAERAALALPLP